jgi:Tfp pilus assembly protein FimT
MPKSSYDSPKVKRHFTLTQDAVDHLDNIASEAKLSRSEALERLIRCTPAWEGSTSLSNGAWSLCVDYTAPELPSSLDDYENLSVD